MQGYSATLTAIDCEDEPSQISVQVRIGDASSPSAGLATAIYLIFQSLERQHLPLLKRALDERQAFTQTGRG